MIRRYKSVFVSKKISATAFFTWVMCFSFHAILPVDIYLSNHSTKKSSHLESHPDMIIYWRVIYWTMIAITFFILPIVRYYLMSGHFTPARRLKESLCINLTWDAIGLIVGALYAFYVWDSGKVQNL
jgi:hypothetical protein